MLLFASWNYTDSLEEITQDIDSFIKITQEGNYSTENYRGFLLFLRRLPW
jgi:hypothetical protein